MCLGSSNMPSESSPALPRLHLRQFVGLLCQKRPPFGPRPLHKQAHRLTRCYVPVSIAVDRGSANAQRNRCRGAGQFLVRQKKLESFRAKHDARFLASCKETCQTKNRTAIFFLTGATSGVLLFRGGNYRGWLGGCSRSAMETCSTIASLLRCLLPGRTFPRSHSLTCWM